MPELNWDGKNAAKTLAADTPLRLLKLNHEYTCNEDSKNLIVQGDNLAALKSLLPFYRARVKCIYIDPPYNTGSAFENYSDNYPHSDWLNMIFPRLQILRDFLADDGAIFISIDDNEQAYLKIICDEIFDRANFVANFVCKSKQGKVGTSNIISTEQEYIICYAKNLSNLKFKMIVKKSDGRKENLRQWGQADRREDRPTMFYPIEIDGKKVFPLKEDGTEGRWRVSEKTAQELLKNNELELVDKKGFLNIYRKFPAGETSMPYGTWIENIATTAKGTIALKKLNLNFAYPKPVELIEFVCNLITDKNAIVLDAFAGSGTTAHAVINLNAADGGNRRFILIEEKDYCKTITAERVKRIGGDYRFYEMGEKLFEGGEINPAVTFEELAKFVWYSETKTPLTSEIKSPLLGICNGAAIYLLEKVLAKRALAALPTFDGKKIIYGTACRFNKKFLDEQGITFKRLKKFLKSM